MSDASLGFITLKNQFIGYIRGITVAHVGRPNEDAAIGAQVKRALAIYDEAFGMIADDPRTSGGAAWDKAAAKLAGSDA